MEPINHVGQLMEILRRQLSNGVRQAGGSSKTVSKADRHVTPGERATTEEIQQKIREKLRRIDVDDEKHQHKSVRIFLESVLLWEFGEQLMEDPKFHVLIDEIQNAMESNPKTLENLKSLLSQL